MGGRLASDAGRLHRSRPRARGDRHGTGSAWQSWGPQAPGEQFGGRVARRQGRGDTPWRCSWEGCRRDPWLDRTLAEHRGTQRQVAGIEAGEAGQTLDVPDHQNARAQLDQALPLQLLKRAVDVHGREAGRIGQVEL
jgi:hypothetical protein